MSPEARLVPSSRLCLDRFTLTHIVTNAHLPECVEIKVLGLESDINEVPDKDSDMTDNLATIARDQLLAPIISNMGAAISSSMGGVQLDDGMFESNQSFQENSAIISTSFAHNGQLHTSSSPFLRLSPGFPSETHAPGPDLSSQPYMYSLNTDAPLEIARRSNLQFSQPYDNKNLTLSVSPMIRGDLTSSNALLNGSLQVNIPDLDLTGKEISGNIFSNSNYSETQGTDDISSRQMEILALNRAIIKPTSHSLSYLCQLCPDKLYRNS